MDNCGKAGKKGQNPSADRLIEQAQKAKSNAYAPYSGFHVGAAVIDDQNRVFTGCNIENSSYGASCCAERTAIFKAVSEGARSIRFLAVICDDDSYCSPCGICRQVAAEFAAADFCLFAARPDGSYRECTLAEILPGSFSLKPPSQHTT